MHVFWPRLFHFVNVLEIDESLDPISFVICNARLAIEIFQCPIYDEFAKMKRCDCRYSRSN